MVLLVFSDKALESSFRRYYHTHAKPVALAYSCFLNAMHVIMLVQHLRRRSVEVDTVSYSLYLIFRTASVLPVTLACLQRSHRSYEAAVLWHRITRTLSLVWTATRPASSTCKAARNLLVDVAIGQVGGVCTPKHPKAHRSPDS